jgi:hypothetical protein
MQFGKLLTGVPGYSYQEMIAYEESYMQVPAE